jgi:hypothetical protein
MAGSARDGGIHCLSSPRALHHVPSTLNSRQINS